ncbi:CLUMA_CG010668, isoform A [Clunio marinus]|uniref:CLUMA_CG010668, isoform A n=1 Tax=Clunio marinus TaxID=568069 RepID=A0A1J1IAI7_9DIPT|nr:CLUMA_CG010668, isoform A [Clunio marinus]
MFNYETYFLMSLNKARQLSYDKRLLLSNFSAIVNFLEGHPFVHLLVIKILSKAYGILFSYASTSATQKSIQRQFL